MGSYRRGAADSGDIDLLVTREPSGSSTHPKTHAGHIQKLWYKMQQDGTAVDVLSRPEDWKALDAKILGLCRLPGRPEAKVRRIDILGVPWSELGAALIYFTGDDYFNRVRLPEEPETRSCAALDRRGRQGTDAAPSDHAPPFLRSSQSIRLKARKHGYRLNQRGLYQVCCCLSPARAASLSLPALAKG